MPKPIVRPFEEFVLPVTPFAATGPIVSALAEFRIQDVHDEIKSGRIACRDLTEVGPLQVALFTKEPRGLGWPHDQEVLEALQEFGWQLAGVRLLLQAAQLRRNLGDRRLILAAGDSFTGPDRRFRSPCYFAHGNQRTLTVAILGTGDPRSRLFMAVRPARARHN